MSCVGSIALFEAGEVKVSAWEVVAKTRAVEREARSRVKEGIGTGGDCGTGLDFYDVRAMGLIGGRCRGHRGVAWAVVLLRPHRKRFVDGIDDVA